MKKFKCPLCQEEHEIDKTGWIQCNVLGYIELGNFIYEMEEWLENRLKGGSQSTTSTKENTKGNTKRR